MTSRLDGMNQMHLNESCFFLDQACRRVTWTLVVLVARGPVLYRIQKTQLDKRPHLCPVAEHLSVPSVCDELLRELKRDSEKNKISINSGFRLRQL